MSSHKEEEITEQDEKDNSDKSDSTKAEEASNDIQTQLAEETAKAENFLRNWQRSEADFANYKKRNDHERDELRRLGNAGLIINLLPVVDDLERALTNLDSHLSGLTWVDGLRLIQRKLELVLEGASVSPIKATGEEFDPRFHEAIQYGEGEEGKVVAEVQRGYRLHDRVLRPAAVVVGQAKSAKDPDNNDREKKVDEEPQQDGERDV